GALRWRKWVGPAPGPRSAERVVADRSAATAGRAAISSHGVLQWAPPLLARLELVELAADFFFRPVQRRAVILLLTGSDEDVAAGDVQSDFNLPEVGSDIEDYGTVHRTVRQAAQTAQDFFGPGPQFVGNLAMASGDGSLHRDLHRWSEAI